MFHLLVENWSHILGILNRSEYFDFLDTEIWFYLLEYLKQTSREMLEEIRNLNFSANETVMVEQEREYSKLFSQYFKQTVSQGLEQWRTQMSVDNYEQMIMQLGSGMAKTLEQIVMSKQYHQMGAIIMEKEIRTIINFLQT